MGRGRCGSYVARVGNDPGAVRQKLGGAAFEFARQGGPGHVFGVGCGHRRERGVPEAGVVGFYPSAAKPKAAVAWGGGGKAELGAAAAKQNCAGCGGGKAELDTAWRRPRVHGEVRVDALDTVVRSARCVERRHSSAPTRTRSRRGTSVEDAVASAVVVAADRHATRCGVVGPAAVSQGSGARLASGFVGAPMLAGGSVVERMRSPPSAASPPA